ncbi:uncharacterized protein LOC129302727 [Prosopis cineraria]|uniref:uncharacterized protein LOC129302727 n=1 Tax=Prosopis cineraria TaxID=364024 RepID=UPI00240F6F03|nr:uncharacterized protein LOC129302727 [Prosopis cineraria]
MEDIRFTDPCERFDSIKINQEPFGQSIKEKELALNNKRMLMEDDKFASSSIAFKCTKRERNCIINQDDNDAIITPAEIQFANAMDIVGNQGHDVEDNNWLSLRPCWEAPFYGETANHQEFQHPQNAEHIPESHEHKRKAKGKEIVVFNDNINGK